MPRPSTKETLLDAGTTQFQTLWNLIDSMTKTQIDAPFCFEDRDKNVRDVLVHLYEWSEMLLTWVDRNKNGSISHFLPEGYNWRTYPALNIEFWKKHQDTNYLDAKALLLQSHQCVMSTINQFTNEELFTKKHFHWTGSTSLGSYCVSATSSHYDWAIKKIKKHIKTMSVKMKKERDEKL